MSKVFSFLLLFLSFQCSAAESLGRPYDHKYSWDEDDTLYCTELDFREEARRNCAEIIKDL